jgi:hypothetical protein
MWVCMSWVPTCSGRWLYGRGDYGVLWFCPFVLHRRHAACCDAFIWDPFRHKLILLLFLGHVIIHILNKTKYDKAHFFLLFSGLQQLESEQRDLNCLCCVHYRVCFWTGDSHTAAGLQTSPNVTLYLFYCGSSVGKATELRVGHPESTRGVLFSTAFKTGCGAHAVYCQMDTQALSLG